jgi:hypothetical protein
MQPLGKGHGPLGHGPLFGKSSISLSVLPRTLNRTSAALSSSSNINDFMEEAEGLIRGCGLKATRDGDNLILR